MSDIDRYFEPYSRRLRTGFFAAAIAPRLSSTLDLTRWVAAGLVLIFHVRINVLADPPDWGTGIGALALRALFLVTSLGPPAVMWFFVVSGYLVGGSVASEIRQNRFSLRRYLIFRFTRLYIVLIPALLIGFALDAGRLAMFGMHVNAGGEVAHGLTPQVLLANLLFLQTIIAPPLGSNNPLWSLAYEGWYYVLFPLLLAPLMTDRLWPRRIGMFLVALAAIIFLRHNPQLLRLFSIWVLGAALRFCPAPLIRSEGVAWALAALGMAIYGVVLDRFGGLANFVVAVTFANLLLTVMHSPRPALRGAKIGAALAGFSYSLYLLHAPMLHFVLTLGRGEADPRLGLSPTDWHAPLIGFGLVLGLVLYAWAMAQVTERQTGRVRAALVGYSRNALHRGRYFLAGH
jgi:peptidoglycan/LPS O-acetylase OafA/YrhL